jgi:hypothetical protein
VIKKIILLILILISFEAKSSYPINFNGYTVGMPVPPNNFNLSWDKFNSISVEQYVCLIGIKNKKNKAASVSLGAISFNTEGSTYDFTLRNNNSNIDKLKYRISFLNYSNNNYVTLKNNDYKKNIRGKKICDRSDARLQKIKITINLNDLRNVNSGSYWDLVFLTTAIKGSVYTYDLFYIFLNLDSGRIQINQLDDINLGKYQVGMGNLSKEEQFCVYVSPDNSYNINIYDNSGAGNTFNLNSGNNKIPYKVFFRTTSTNYFPISNGSTTGSFIGNSSQNCTIQEGNLGGERAYIKLEVNESNLENALPENYTGQIYLTVSPE